MTDFVKQIGSGRLDTARDPIAFTAVDIALDVKHHPTHIGCKVGAVLFGAHDTAAFVVEEIRQQVLEIVVAA